MSAGRVGDPGFAPRRIEVLAALGAGTGGGCLIEIGGAGTLGACGHVLLTAGAGQPRDDLAGQGGAFFQGHGQFFRTEFRPALGTGAGLQPPDDLPPALLGLQQRVLGWSGRAGTAVGDPGLRGRRPGWPGLARSGAG